MSFVKFILVAACTLQVCLPRLDNRIIGGKFCKVTEYPFIVSLDSGIVCGGTLIKLDWVLTAAHCLTGPEVISVRKMEIRAGFDNYVNSTSKNLQLRYGKYRFPHKKYAYEAHDIVHPDIRNDIGLLLLVEPFERSPFVNVALLPKPGFTKRCKSGTVVGAGLAYPPSLMRFLVTDPINCAELSIIDQETCGKNWLESVDDDDDLILCTIDVCKGDSGGPLVCRNVVIGVITMEKGCGTPNMSLVYTKTEAYLEFISDIMEETRSKSLRNTCDYFLTVLCVIIVTFKNFLICQ